MVSKYNVTGMTCNGCKNSVESALNTLPKVDNAEVHLEESEVRITMSEIIPVSEFQKALPTKFVISEIDTKTKEHVGFKKNEWKQLYPLFLIFGYITAASFLLNYKPWELSNFMLDFMGLFYVVFSFFKFLDLKGFPKSFKMYDPLAKVIPVYGWVYPFIEAILGVMFLMRFKILIALIVTLVILGITTIGVIKTLLDKKTIQCACLGTALKLPMTKATFIENSIMIIMAIMMLLNF